MLLLADRQAYIDPLKPDLECYAFDLLIVIADIDRMRSGASNSAYLGQHGMIAIAGETIHHCAHDKMGTKFLDQAIKLIDIAIPVAHMNALLRLPKQGNRLAQILEPENAFLGLDRNARGIDLALELGSPFEFFPVPELDHRQAKGQPVFRHRKAGIHQDAIDRMVVYPAILVPAAIDGLRKSNIVGLRRWYVNSVVS